MALSTEQNYNMINGLLNNVPVLAVRPSEKELNKVKGSQQARELGAWGSMIKKRCRCVHFHVMVTPEEQSLIREGIEFRQRFYMQKMAMNGYVLRVNLSDIRKFVSLQRWCANNLNQVAIHVNTNGGIYPD